MTIYSLYIFDRYLAILSIITAIDHDNRHCACIYYQDWHRVQRPKPAVAGNILLNVARAVTPQPTTTLSQVEFTSPRNTLTYSSGVVVAIGEPSPSAPAVPAKTPPVTTAPMSKLSFDEEAKLVYGVIFSLKNMVQKLSGRCVLFSHWYP